MLRVATVVGTTDPRVVDIHDSGWGLEHVEVGRSRALFNFVDDLIRRETAAEHRWPCPGDAAISALSQALCAIEALDPVVKARLFDAIARKFCELRAAYVVLHDGRP